MIALTLDAPFINSAMRQALPDYRLEYRDGCLLASVPLSLGTVSLVVVPHCTATHLVFILPFQEVRSEKAPAFLLATLVGVLWGSISKQIESRLLPKIRDAGLSPDTVTSQRVNTPDGDTGQILVSLEAINSWLSQRHPRLSAHVSEVRFESDSVEIRSGLSRKATKSATTV